MIAGKRCVIVGEQIDVWLWTSEISLLYGGFERLMGHPKDFQDVECDIAIINCPELYKGWRLPKAKVNLFLGIESKRQYQEKVFRGQPYDFDEFAHTWDGAIFCANGVEHWRNLPGFNAFQFDPFCRWGPVPSYCDVAPSFSSRGCLLGSQSGHRKSVVANAGGLIKWVSGGQPVLEEIRQHGLAVNLHGTAGEIKTEAAKLSCYVNVGCAVISEPLDNYLPTRFRGAILETRDVVEWFPGPAKSKKLAEQTRDVMYSHHDMREECEKLVLNIASVYRL